MRVQVLVERVKGNGCRAVGTSPLSLSAKGSTRAEALAKLRTKIETRLNNGTELVSLHVGQSEHPWMKFAGMFADEPWIDDWVQSMAEYREHVEKKSCR